MPEDQDNRPVPRRAAAWLELLRLPNLLTVPGDPLIGFSMAILAGAAGSWAAVFPAMSAALLLYAGGLVQNDLVDVAIDARQRPGRPLPSGRVGIRAAAVAMCLLLVSGVAVALLTRQSAAIYTAGGLLLAVTFYNHVAKRIPVIGSLMMGICRGLSVLLGASAAGGVTVLSSPLVWLTAGTVTFYIAAVTAIAATETEVRRRGMLSYLPAFFLGMGIGAIGGLVFRNTGVLGVSVAECTAAVLTAVVALLGAAMLGRTLRATVPPALVQRAIGVFLRNLLLIQAVAVALIWWPAALLVVPVLMLAALTSQRFYAS